MRDRPIHGRHMDITMQNHCPRVGTPPLSSAVLGWAASFVPVPWVCIHSMWKAPSLSYKQLSKLIRWSQFTEHRFGRGQVGHCPNVGKACCGKGNWDAGKVRNAPPNDVSMKRSRVRTLMGRSVFRWAREYSSWGHTFRGLRCFHQWRVRNTTFRAF